VVDGDPGNVDQHEDLGHDVGQVGKRAPRLKTGQVEDHVEQAGAGVEAQKDLPVVHRRRGDSKQQTFNNRTNR